LCSKSSSSRGSSEPEWLVVGRVAKPHGVHGEIIAEVISDFPERLVSGVLFGLGEGSQPTAFFRVHRVRVHKRRWLIAVDGIRDRETVDGWRGQYIFLPEQSLDDLPKGYYYEHHLVGLLCRSVAGVDLGEVVGVDPGASQTRLVVRRGDREFLVPYVPAIVTEVDLEARRVILDPPAGLLDDDAVEA
jgi:16S rRNA processing protein RimM